MAASRFSAPLLSAQGGGTLARSSIALVTPTPSPSPSPAPTPRPSMKPSREVQFDSGITERHDLVVPTNFDAYFSRVTMDQFAALLAEQPDLPAFPFNPKDADFSIGDRTNPRDPGVRYLVIYCPNVEVHSPLQATSLTVDPYEVFAGRIESGTGYFVGFAALGGNPRARGLVVTEDVKGRSEFRAASGQPQTHREDVAISEGMYLFDFLGSDAISNQGQYYSADPNQLHATLTKRVIPSAANSYTAGPVTDLFPSLDDWQGWVHTDDGRIAIVSGK